MIVYLICFLFSFVMARLGHYYVSGALLLAAALYLYIKDYLCSRNFIHLRALFSLFWVGGQGISCFKLSRLQTDWSPLTWLCFLAAFSGFWVTFEILERKRGRGRGELSHLWRADFNRDRRPLLLSMAVITLVSVGCFLLEAVVLGYIPYFLRGVPHAYSEFHISGVHYFTVACVLIPSLSVIYSGSVRGRRGGLRSAVMDIAAVAVPVTLTFLFLFIPAALTGVAALLYFIKRIGRDRDGFAAVVLMDAAAVAIPILCVSRFQLILAVALAVLTYLCMNLRSSIWLAFAAVLALIPVYILLTVARSHDITYLNGIFEMKNSQIPIFVTQPYMYVANNYDNFNCLVTQLSEHSWGLKMLFPLWALTGLKFLVLSLVNFPIFVTKEELTTVTLFYDAYYDFGIVGVVIFSCILGGAAWYLSRMIKRVHNPVGYLFYAQIAMYFILSFFTTWFSNPTTWFWLALTGAVAWYVDRG